MEDICGLESRGLPPVAATLHRRAGLGQSLEGGPFSLVVELSHAMAESDRGRAELSRGQAGPGRAQPG